MAEVNYQQVYEVSRNDAKWKELMERIRGYHLNASEYKQKQRAAIRKIVQFDKLEDLAMDRMGTCEGSEHDEALLECTGADQETHFWSWSGAQDLCFDGMVEAAIACSNAQSMIEVVKDKIKEPLLSKTTERKRSVLHSKPMRNPPNETSH